MSKKSEVMLSAMQKSRSVDAEKKNNRNIIDGITGTCMGKINAVVKKGRKMDEEEDKKGDKYICLR